MRYRNSAYTGRNRCWPCTWLNLGLTALVAGVLAAIGRPTVAVLAAVVGALAVGLRGYLIPRTPALTHELPESVLDGLGKTDPAASLPASDSLIASGVLDDDLAIDPAAAEYVTERAESLLADPETLKATIPEVYPNAVKTSVRRSLGGTENWFVRDADEMTVRQWGARPIAAIDVAGAEYLSEVLPDWVARSAHARRTMLALLRYRIPDCPSCGEVFTAPDGPNVTCCGGRSLVGERQCENCGYALVDRNDLPTEATEDEYDRGR